MKKAWLMATVALITGIVFTMGLFKVPPTMILLMQDLHVGIGIIGLTMSVCAIASAVISLPGGAIMQKVGFKKFGIAAIIISILGTVIAIIGTSFTTMLISRIIEGACVGMMFITIPAIISAWFPPEKRGLPMAIFSLWMSIGMLIIFNLTNMVVPSYGWKGLWWLSAILLAMMGVIFALVIKKPANEAAQTASQSPVTAKVPLSVGFKSLSAWLLGITFATFAITNTAFNSFYPTFLQQSLGLDMASANSLTSITTIGSIVGGVIVGIILNKIKNKNHGILLIVSMILAGVFAFVQFNISSNGILIPFVIVCGVVYQMAPPILFTMAPDVAPMPEAIPVTISIVTLGSALGGILGSAIIGPIVEASKGNWNAVSIPLLGILAIGIIASVLLQVIRSKKAVRQQSEYAK
ncbi:MFS transporter [Dehalobacter sp. DCM]|uniref:MFS transporter n=1 Tax=Dehalobacter sp. DCM TaxID=2907827 RepID=UPI0030819B78|nr:MFS transporter [Dehalobacter sp. DCM]